MDMVGVWLKNQKDPPADECPGDESGTVEYNKYDPLTWVRVVVDGILALDT